MPVTGWGCPVTGKLMPVTGKLVRVTGQAMPPPEGRAGRDGRPIRS